MDTESQGSFRQQNLARYLQAEREKSSLDNRIQNQRLEKQRQPRSTTNQSENELKNAEMPRGRTQTLSTLAAARANSHSLESRRSEYNDTQSIFSEAPPPSKPREVEDDPWGTLLMLRAERDRAQVEGESQKIVDRMKVVHSNITNQMEERKKERSQRQKEEEAYGKIFMKEHEVAVQADQAKEMQRLKKRLEVKAVCEDQMRLELERKEKEKQKQIDFDKQLLRRNMRELEAEKRKTLEKKKVIREQMHITLQENNKKVEAKQVAKALDKEEDKALMAAYSKLLEEREKERRDHYAKLDEKMHAHVDNYWLKAGASLAEKAAADEAKARRIQIAHDAEQNRIADERQEKLKREKAAVKKSLEEQLRHQEIQREILREEDRSWMRQNLENVIEDQKVVAAEKETIQNTKVKYANDLNNQMAHIKQCRKDMVMNEHERKMNAGLLKEVMTEAQMKGVNNSEGMELAKFTRAKNLNVGLKKMF